MIEAWGLEWEEFDGEDKWKPMFYVHGDIEVIKFRRKLILQTKDIFRNVGEVVRLVPESKSVG